jgi:S1-C subfamily serine protease
MKRIVVFSVVAISILGCVSKQQRVEIERPVPGERRSEETASAPKFLKKSINYLEVSNQILSSCFAVKRPRDGKIVFITAYHGLSKLSESQKATLVLGAEQKKVTRILKANPTLDIAAFEIDSTEGVSPLSFGETNLFSLVFVESYSYLPFLKSIKYILSKGYTLFYEGGRCYFAINIFYPGGSGAPIFNEKLEVCAMAVQRLTSGTDEIYTGVVNAIPSDMLRQFVASL